MEQESIAATAFSSGTEFTYISSAYGAYRYKENSVIANRFHVYHRAAGGFGHVYLCYDHEQDYFYALKTFKLGQKVLDDPNTIQRLQREVELWVALGEHAHIVRCFGLEVIDNLPFILLEWVADTDYLNTLYNGLRQHSSKFQDWYARLGRQGLELRRRQAYRNHMSNGTSLYGWLKKKGFLEPEFALRIILQICSGLIHAQSIHPGLIHRDLKPDNILLNEQLFAKVSDFGIAVIAQDLLDEGRSFGVPAYKAPEQWSQSTIDARTDIYALGCILFEMLTGKPPFLAPGLSVDEQRKYIRQQHENVRPPSLSSQFPRRLNDLIQICLQKDPSARFASVTEFADTLSTIYTGITSTSPKQVSEMKPSTVEEINKVGVTYFNLEKYDLAFAQFQRALELDATYANTYTNRGCVYHVLGQWEAALADYAQAIRLGRSSINAKVQNNRGLLYLMQNEPKRALRDLNRAIELAPDYANAYVNRGLAYVQIDQYDQALNDFEYALRLNPKHVLAKYNRAYLYQRLGNLQLALNGYTDLLEQDPTFLLASINRSMLYAELGRKEHVEHEQIAKFQLVSSGDQREREAAFQLSRPDPQFVNEGSLEELVLQPFREMEVNKRRWDKILGLASKPEQQLPLHALVSVNEVKYAEWLHERIQQQQNQGQRITQVTVYVEVIQGDGQYKPFSDMQEWNLIIDDEATRLMEASGLQTIYDLTRHWLVLRNDHPDDLRHPLHIDNIL